MILLQYKSDCVTSLLRTFLWFSMLIAPRWDWEGHPLSPFHLTITFYLLASLFQPLRSIPVSGVSPLSVIPFKLKIHRLFHFKKWFYFLNYVYKCVSVWTCEYRCRGIYKRTLDPLSLSCMQVWIAWYGCQEPSKSTVRTVRILNLLAISPSMFLFILDRVLSIQVGLKILGTRNDLECLIILFPPPEYLDCKCAPLCWCI